MIDRRKTLRYWKFVILFRAKAFLSEIFAYTIPTLADPCERTVIEYSDRSLTVL